MPVLLLLIYMPLSLMATGAESGFGSIERAVAPDRPWKSVVGGTCTTGVGEVDVVGDPQACSVPCARSNAGQDPRRPGEEDVQERYLDCTSLP